ncbi:MAG: hypothetical protein HZB41_02925 [Ignavibacteriae bacterium]|nr:hypothetical protein [Ignavibacteriota bacterium]
MEIDLKWTSPSDKELFWDGKKNKINELYITLNQITILNPIIIKLEGELITISSKGKFELLTKEDKRIFGKFSNDLLGKMKERHIGEICIFIIEEQKLFNPISNTEKHEYHLKDIKHK